MRHYWLMISAAGFVAFGHAVHAANRDVQSYLDKTSAEAAAKVASAGVDVGKGLRVKARVFGDGRLFGAHVVGSSGSLETDLKTHKVLRRLRVAAPPNALIGANVTVPVGQPAFIQARTP